MFCISGFILFDGIGEKPCAEHRELNSIISSSGTFTYIYLFCMRYFVYVFFLPFPVLHELTAACDYGTPGSFHLKV